MGDSTSQTNWPRGLLILARIIRRQDGIPEPLWKGRKRRRNLLPYLTPYYFFEASGPALLLSLPGVFHLDVLKWATESLGRFLGKSKESLGQPYVLTRTFDCHPSWVIPN